MSTKPLTVKVALERLQYVFPLPYIHIKIRYCSLGDTLNGDCDVTERKDGQLVGLIRINEDLSLHERVQTLVHEYAHLMHYTYPGRNQDGAWALAYAECYAEIWGSH